MKDKEIAKSPMAAEMYHQLPKLVAKFRAPCTCQRPLQGLKQEAQEGGASVGRELNWHQVRLIDVLWGDESFLQFPVKVIKGS